MLLQHNNKACDRPAQSCSRHTQERARLKLNDFMMRLTWQGRVTLHRVQRAINTGRGLFDFSHQFVIMSSILHHNLLHRQRSLDLGAGGLAVMYFQVNFLVRRRQLHCTSELRLRRGRTANKRAAAGSKSVRDTTESERSGAKGSIDHNCRWCRAEMSAQVIGRGGGGGVRTAENR